MKTSSDWRDFAVCKGVDPDLFHPAKDDVEGERRAKAICAKCPVREACLDYAITNDERHGIWGGYGERTRRVMRRERRVGRLAS